jgi:hypothetical protein
VFFESSNGSLSGVLAMTVGGNKLIFHVIDSEKVFQSGECFVGKGLNFGFETLGSEFLMDVVICFDPFRSVPGLHWDNNDVITVKNITDNNVPVAPAGPNWKFSR